MSFCNSENNARLYTYALISDHFHSPFSVLLSLNLILVMLSLYGVHSVMALARKSIDTFTSLSFRFPPHLVGIA